MQRENDAHPIELVEGQVYSVTLNDGTVCKLTPYNIRVQIEAHGPINVHDKIGPVTQEPAPADSDPTGGWGTLEEAVWDGTSFVRPLLSSTPLTTPDAPTLSGMLAAVRAADYANRIKEAYPSYKVDPTAVASRADVALLEGIRLAMNGLFFLANDIRTRTSQPLLDKPTFATAISSLNTFSREEVASFLLDKTAT
jgi:hypothetical protein